MQLRTSDSRLVITHCQWYSTGFKLTVRQRIQGGEVSAKVPYSALDKPGAHLISLEH